ncbi:MAG: 3-hydroxyacyl-CoA dehydrogenase NAD-binding domain-containing protein [Ginsengibacter sp.]
MISTICVCGAGTMGAGIAQVSAKSGFRTILFDVNPGSVTRSKQLIEKSLQKEEEKQKISAGQRIEIFSLIQFVTEIENCKGDLIIEAIVENMGAKVSLFNQLSEYNSGEVIFATNTSSLRISEIQKNVIVPGRIAGMHFFNPAPVMKLVEVIKGDQTTDATIHHITGLVKQMGKVPVLCKDVPGFIVNRVARQYYLEAMKLLETEVATVENIDTLMESAGFKMGPFKLMDLIGMDINLSVSQSIYEAFHNAERFKPSQVQIEKVNKAELGRKTNKGFYNYNQ